MDKLYIQYGCGLSAPEKMEELRHFTNLTNTKDPTNRNTLEKQIEHCFSDNVLYGDIVKGIPVTDNSCDGVYCSHVLEHLSLNDFRTALKNTYKILKPGGLFRCVVPDLEVIAKRYVDAVNNKKENASIDFCGNGSLMGVTQRTKGLKGILTNQFGNAHHLWMWDHYSLSAELLKAGFKDIRRAQFNDSSDDMFKLVEDQTRFESAVALECRK